MCQSCIRSQFCIVTDRIFCADWRLDFASCNSFQPRFSVVVTHARALDLSFAQNSQIYVAMDFVFSLRHFPRVITKWPKIYFSEKNDWAFDYLPPKIVQNLLQNPR